MDEQKIQDLHLLLQSQHPSSLQQPQTIIAQWQWQSGLDPWKDQDPANWIWQNYSSNDCRIIETAFLLGQDFADLTDYEVTLKDLLQINKNDRNRVRRVRRKQDSRRFMMEMPRPKIIIKGQKTMNEAFGTIQQFLDYIMKRTPEAYGLYQRLRTLSLDSKKDEFQDIIQQVINFITKGAEAREKTIRPDTNLAPEAQEITSFLLNNLATLRDFLKAILKVYTMETFICYWLNELLRSEDWEEINVLTPYLVCLVYTFKLSDYTLSSQRGGGWIKTLFKKKLMLFRGAALTQEHLAQYDPKKVKYFSWNAVTSTSRNKNIALSFIEPSPAKATVGVMFIIESGVTSIEDCEGMIDTLQNCCSEYPEEQEIILAPGTVFKLREVCFIKKDNIYEIRLTIKKKFEKTQENSSLLGFLLAEAINNDKGIIEGLPSQKGFKILDLLKGNKFIKKLEIRNSGMEEHIMEEIENLRLTTNIKKQDIKLINNTIVISSLSLFAHYFPPENWSEIFSSNKIRFRPRGEAPQKQHRKIESLVLTEGVLKAFKDQLKDFWNQIKQENQIQSVYFSMKNLAISPEDFRDFLDSIKELKSLESLTLKLSPYQEASNQDFIRLCRTIESFPVLKKLILEQALPDEGLYFIKEAFSSLQYSLQYLSLDFYSSPQISDEALNHLKISLPSLQLLQHLSLNFKNCKQISDTSLYHLKTLFPSFPHLQNVSLDFSGCNRISNAGLDHLNKALQSLTTLRHLSLDFSNCEKVSEEGLGYLQTALISLTSLQSLSINFNSCKKLSEERVKQLNTQLIMFLPALQNLSLNF